MTDAHGLESEPAREHVNRGLVPALALQFVVLFDDLRDLAKINVRAIRVSKSGEDRSAD